MNLQTVHRAMFKKASMHKTSGILDWLLGIDRTHDSDPKKPRFTLKEPKAPDLNKYYAPLPWDLTNSTPPIDMARYDKDLKAYREAKESYTKAHAAYKDQLKAYLADKNDPRAGEKFYKNVYLPWQQSRKRVAMSDKSGL